MGSEWPKCVKYELDVDKTNRNYIVISVVDWLFGSGSAVTAILIQ